ncbi:MAG: toxin-antitoxin system YwqK family antitoxin [Flavobacteriia bacterium]|nr:toxin-antitoxin system YwqK family antitoxin [Flavobacteriia bacterium]
MEKKSIVLIIFILVTFIFCAQPINQLDEKGKKQGVWKVNYPKSKAFIYVGEFKDDVPIGTFTYYYPSTKTKAQIVHDKKGVRSVAVFYHENGAIMSKGIYKNQKKDSIWLNYGPSGRISFKENYINGKLHGQKIIYYVPEDPNDNSKNIARIENYQNDALHGEVKEFFDFGVVKLTGKYVNGKKEGKFITNHINGKPMSIELYKNGVKHGFSIGYDENGKELGRRYYKNGKELIEKELDSWLNYCKQNGISPND